MAWADLRNAEVRYEHSPLETARFGVSMGRLTIGMATPPPRITPPVASAEREVVRSLKEAADQVVVVRFDAAEPAWSRVLALSGRALLPAGALVYWQAPLGVSTEPLGSGSRRASAHDRDVCTQFARELSPQDVGAARAAVEAVVRESFAAYPNHYAANPLLGRNLALEGYVEWALGALNARGEEVIVLWEGQRPVGIATVTDDPNGDDLEILLAGLIPEAQGRGLYPHLLHAAGEAARVRGRRRVIISTQAHNARVQRAWIKQGLLPFAAIETVHAVRS